MSSCQSRHHLYFVGELSSCQLSSRNHGAYVSGIINKITETREGKSCFFFNDIAFLLSYLLQQLSRQQPSWAQGTPPPRERQSHRLSPAMKP